MSTVVDKSNDRIREMFGQIARRYDFLNHFLSAGIDRHWRARTVRQVAPRGDAPILDVCTGTGDLALGYWQVGRGQIDVIGTDFTPQMLDIARQKWDQMRVRSPEADESSLTFLEADTQALPFEDDRFQIVSVAFGIRNVADCDRGLAEMLRVCQPGGRVAVLEFSLPSQGGLGWLYQQYFRKLLPKIGQWFARNQQSAYNYLPASVAEFPYGEAFAERMRAAGLVDVTWTTMTLGIVTLYVGHKPASASKES